LTRVLRFAPALTVALLLAPVLAGLAGTLAPAFGYLPGIGRDAFSLDPWRELFDTPGLATSLRLTIHSGLAATALSLLLAAGFVATAARVPALRRLEQAVAPLLATPHAALAIGFAFLILPSGWIARLISPELTGWERPPALVTVRDPFGVSFVLGLAVKEVPYLILMLVAALNQLPHREAMAAGRALGYAPAKAWLVGVFPRLYAQIRLPVYAVLAFSLSVVDVALVLAPGTPPPLAVLATRWFSDYDLSLYPRAAAAATLQLVIVLAAILAWRLGEIAVARAGRRWIESGGRTTAFGPVLTVSAGLAGLLAAAAFVALAGLALWSVAGDWRFPDAWPDALTGEVWARHAGEIARPAGATLAIGALATGAAVVLVLACLEHEARAGAAPGRGATLILYLPLLVPQIAFVFGLQVFLVRAGADGTLLAVAWAHLVFVLPYVFLSLADPFRALDRRYERASAALGAGPAATFFRVKLPILLRPVLIALAIGFAVSVAQYLPTLFAGAGRIATLTTEAVTLASGADRRILGVYGALQAAMPALVYLAALLVPLILYRRRRGLA